MRMHGGHMRVLFILCIPMSTGLLGCAGDKDDDASGSGFDCVQDCRDHEGLFEALLDLGEGFDSTAYQNQCEGATSIDDC